MGGLEESTGEGAAKVGGNASLTGASNDMSSRKEHLLDISFEAPVRLALPPTLAAPSPVLSSNPPIELHF